MSDGAAVDPVAEVLARSHDAFAADARWRISLLMNSHSHRIEAIT
jgi:hypothetical protein